MWTTIWPKIWTWAKTPQGRIVWLSVLATVILPLVAGPLFHLPVPLRIGLIFILLDMTLAILFGRWLGHYHLPWWYSLVLPLLFAAMVFLRYAQYNYTLVPIYFLLTWLAYSRE